MTTELTSSIDLSRLTSDTPIEYAVSQGVVNFPDAVAFMEARASAIHAGSARELIWFLEHPPLYTAGTSAKPEDLLRADAFPVFKASRGGQYTYHGPGQRVVYIMLDLSKRGRDLRAFVHGLEQWVIGALDEFGVKGERRAGRVGVWVDRTQTGGALREDKIAAIGVRVRKWVSFHGISINVEPDLSHFNSIAPCGVREDGLGVTSLVDLGRPVTMSDVDHALLTQFTQIFGPVEERSLAPF